MGAIISQCGKFRYILTRDSLIPLTCAYTMSGPLTCCFVMLNPSTADATEDDSTIRKCIKYAKREGCDDLIVVNLYPYRSTDPKEMLKTEERFGTDDMNSRWMNKALQVADVIICGWGNHAEPQAVENFKTIIQDTDINAEPQCFAINKNGSPKHPLYVKDDAPLIPWLMN